MPYLADFSKAILQLQHSRSWRSSPPLLSMASMLGSMGEGMKEAAKKQVEDELAAKALGTWNSICHSH